MTIDVNTIKHFVCHTHNNVLMALTGLCKMIIHRNVCSLLHHISNLIISSVVLSGGMQGCGDVFLVSLGNQSLLDPGGGPVPAQLNLHGFPV